MQTWIEQPAPKDEPPFLAGAASGAAVSKRQDTSTVKPVVLVAQKAKINALKKRKK